jgi:hypothetical protein
MQVLAISNEPVCNPRGLRIGVILSGRYVSSLAALGGVDVGKAIIAGSFSFKILAPRSLPTNDPCA